MGFLEKESGRHVRFSITRLRGQAVKTSPFHGGNTGSIPVGVISVQMLADDPHSLQQKEVPARVLDL